MLGEYCHDHKPTLLLTGGCCVSNKDHADAKGFLASGLGIAIISSAVFGTSGSFAKSMLETGWSPGAAVAVRLSGAASSC